MQSGTVFGFASMIDGLCEKLEEELGAVLFVRSKGGLKLTPQGEIAVKYARRLKALDQKLHRELINVEKSITNLRIGITHTAESNPIAEALAKYCAANEGISIKMITDTISNLYTMLNTYELDLAIVEGRIADPNIHYLLLDTDYLVLAVSVNQRLYMLADGRLGDGQLLRRLGIAF